MREIIIIAGPNGAGKTTFATSFMRATGGLAFINADEIAHGISYAATPAQRDVRAGRLMLQRIDALAAARAEFVFETTLASLSYAPRITAWRALGYHVGLAFLRLPNVEASVARVQRRVAAGGHDIPEPIIRRRFARAWRTLKPATNPS